VSIGIELMFAQNGGYFARAREAFASSVTVAHAPIATTTGWSACIFIHRGPARKYALMLRGVLGQGKSFGGLACGNRIVMLSWLTFLGSEQIRRGELQVLGSPELNSRSSGAAQLPGAVCRDGVGGREKAGEGGAGFYPCRETVRSGS
jgi:hypothetical protein